MKRNNITITGFPVYTLPPPTVPVTKKVMLSNDPSMTGWGYVVIEPVTNKVLEAGCIKTTPRSRKLRIRKGDDTVRRVSEINQVLLDLFDKYEIVYICSELPHGSQNASAAVMIGIVTGIMQTIADCKKTSLEWYSEGDSKKCLLGKRAAVKNDTKQAIAKLYQMPWTNTGYKDEAIADAMAVYHVATFSSSILKYLNK